MDFINALEKFLHAVFFTFCRDPVRPLPSGDTELFDVRIVNDIPVKIEKFASMFPDVWWICKRDLSDVYYKPVGA